MILKSTPIEAYADGIAAGHRNDHYQHFIDFPPNPFDKETEPEHYAKWEEGLLDGDGDSYAMRYAD